MTHNNTSCTCSKKNDDISSGLETVCMYANTPPQANQHPKNSSSSSLIQRSSQVICKTQCGVQWVMGCDYRHVWFAIKQRQINLAKVHLNGFYFSNSHQLRSLETSSRHLLGINHNQIIGATHFRPRIRDIFEKQDSATYRHFFNTEHKLVLTSRVQSHSVHRATWLVHPVLHLCLLLAILMGMSTCSTLQTGRFPSWILSSSNSTSFI